MYIGIDASLTSTGIAVLDENGFSTQVLKSKSSLRGPERLDYLQNEFIKILGEIKNSHDPIEGCAIEGYAMGMRQPGRLADIGEWGGLVRLTLYRQSIPTIVVPPTNLKKYISGSGGTKKNLIVMKVLQKYGIECKTDDEADALGLSAMAADYFGEGAELAYEREALEKVAPLYVRKVVRSR